MRGECDMIDQLVTTVVGWNAPNGTNFNNGLPAMLLIVAMIAVFSAIPLAFNYRGDTVITLALLGAVVGSALGMLTWNASNPTVVPFGMLVVSAICFALWLWHGGKG